VLGSEARAEYLGRRLDYYPYYRMVNETLPPDARVWLINMRRDTYHLERAYFSDYFAEDHTLRRWVETSTSPVELHARARRLGITHVLVRHDVLLDYGRSVLVDDARPLAQNVARLNLARGFLVDGTTVLRVDRKFLLAALPPAR
jgi:diadenosine tetraphosphatase ApaH/serine/threonine PP2A family protein phosphatase